MQKAIIFKSITVLAVGLFSFAGTALADGEWSTSGSNIFNTNTGNVGIGTNTPTAKLDVLGDSSGNIGVELKIKNSNSSGYASCYLYNDIGLIGGIQSVGSNYVLSKIRNDIELASRSSGKNINMVLNNVGTSFNIMDGARTELMTVSRTGNVGIGTMSPGAPLTVNKNSTTLRAPIAGTLVQIGQADGVFNVLLMDGYGAPPIFVGRRAQGTAALPSAIDVGGRIITSLAGYGYGTTGYSSDSRAEVRLLSEEAWTDAAQGTRISFLTTANGTTTPLDRLIIKNDGNIGIGTTVPGAPLEVYKDGGPVDTTGGGMIFSRYHGGAHFRGGAIYSRFINSVGSDALVFGVTSDNAKNPYSDFDQARMAIFANGRVGIGTTSPQSTLAVNGTITTKKIKVTETGWSDFVFDEGYKLLSLAAVESHIKQYKHLPGLPSAQEIQKKGLDVSDILAKQMQKIEELTLYVIELQKQIEELKKR